MSALTVSEISADFVDFVREQTLVQGAYTAYVANALQVFAGRLHGDERYLVIDLPDMDPTEVQNRSAQIHAEVRRTELGYPIACVMFADRFVEVSADFVRFAFPIRDGRLNVLWIFRKEVALESYVYTGQMETDLACASIVAESHRHDYSPYDEFGECTPVEVHRGFVLNGVLPSYS
ncbi:hypothetical protein [Paraburkholderia caribensis]|uniref:hypothetical protein n=1 Tax=Paraburkholderia caribensis TaxID=75105 RepID=UPI0012E890B9|nr:hypothetical protein [Paraburkholderia caribensis]